MQKVCLKSKNIVKHEVVSNKIYLAYLLNSINLAQSQKTIFFKKINVIEPQNYECKEKVNPLTQTKIKSFISIWGDARWSNVQKIQEDDDKKEDQRNLQDTPCFRI